MRTVSAREANQQFSKILEMAAGGEEVTITRRGVPVAKLVPVPGGDAEAAERERRKREALEFLKKGVPLGPTIPWTRDEIYMERLERRERGSAE
jgi:prevent-host-death family protein